MAAEDAVRCLHCGAATVERLALFGSQLMTSQYRCRACDTIFEQVRWGAPLAAPTEAPQSAADTDYSQ